MADLLAIIYFVGVGITLILMILNLYFRWLDIINEFFDENFIGVFETSLLWPFAVVYMMHCIVTYLLEQLSKKGKEREKRIEYQKQINKTINKDYGWDNQRIIGKSF